VDATRKFVVQKVHSWRGKYPRVFCLAETGFSTLDPKNFTVTNTWKYSEIMALTASEGDPKEFVIVLPKEGGMLGKKSMSLKFVCEYRSYLLSELQKMRGAGAAGRAPRILCSKMTRHDNRRECLLEATVSSLLQWAPDGTLLSTYDYKDVEKVIMLSDEAGFAVYSLGRGKLFLTPEKKELVGSMRAAAAAIGVNIHLSSKAMTLDEFQAERAQYGVSSLPALAEYRVNKLSARYTEPVARKLITNQESLVERDSKTFSVVSSRSLRSIFALVRYWDEPQKMGIEFVDGFSRHYLCADRDAAIASILDAARAAGNGRIGVNATVDSGGLRVMPRCADPGIDMQAALMRRLPPLERREKGDAAEFTQDLVQGASELIANVRAVGAVVVPSPSLSQHGALGWVGCARARVRVCGLCVCVSSKRSVGV
jgi:DnaJ family protein C protein 13